MTPCYIIKVFEDGTCKLCTCRSDGYASGVGRYLLKHYEDEAKIDRLLEKLSFSPMEADPDDLCTNYHPDDDPRPERYPSLTAAVNTFNWGFDNLFVRKNGQWHMARFSYNGKNGQYRVGKLVPLTKEQVIKEAHWDVAAWFESTERDPTFREKMASDFAHMQKQAMRTPGMTVFGDPSRGIMGVSMTSGGFPGEAAEDVGGDDAARRDRLRAYILAMVGRDDPEAIAAADELLKDLGNDAAIPPGDDSGA